MPCCDPRSRAGGKRLRRNGRAHLLYFVEPTTLAHPPPHSPSKDGRSSERPMWGREGWGVARAEEISACTPALLSLRSARPPSSVLPHKGGGSELLPAANAGLDILGRADVEPGIGRIRRRSLAVLHVLQRVHDLVAHIERPLSDIATRETRPQVVELHRQRVRDRDGDLSAADLVFELAHRVLVGVDEELAKASSRHEGVELGILVEQVLLHLHGEREVVVRVLRTAVDFGPSILAGELLARRLGALLTGQSVADALHAFVMVRRRGAARLDAD